jgi:AcrR family transcriptional regulator
MPRTRRPAIAKLDTRTAVIKTARYVLMTKGLSALSMRRVAATCGITAAAIYRHFEDKDALVNAAVEEGFRALSSYLMDGLEASTPQKRLRRTVRRYLDFAIENPHDYQLIFMSQGAEDGLSKLAETSTTEISAAFQLFQDRIVEGQRTGVVRRGPVRGLAIVAWSMAHGLASLLVAGHLDEKDKQLEKLIKAQLDAIERTVAP